MSGVFKNFDRIVCASNFNKVNHNYIVKTCMHNFAPAFLYYNPSEALGRTHGKDIFQLSLVAYQLQRENSQHSEWLQNISEEEHADFYSEVVAKSQKNQQYISDALNEISLQFNVGVSTSQPIEALTSYAYILAQQSNQAESVKIFNTHLKAQIVEKLQYASQQNIIDLVSALTTLNITDAAVWKGVTGVIQNKTFDWQLNTVNYHAWETDQYEAPESTPAECVVSPMQQYYNAIVSGNAGFVAQATKRVNELRNELFFRYISPFFLRESRPHQFFNNIDSEGEKESLRANLQTASQKVPQAAEALKAIQGKGI